MSCVVYLISFEDETAYIGSTKDLQGRMNSHRKNAFTDKQDIPLYCKMRECAYGVSVLEETTKENRTICEQKWIDELKPDLNCRNAFTSKELRREKNRNYREQNKEHFKKLRKLTEDKEQIKNYNKKRYDETKDIVLKRKAEKIVCECGAIICRGAYAEHKLTKKHLNNI